MRAEAATRPLCILAAGGTGGHMFPAESLARALITRGWRIGLVTDARGARYAEEFPAEFAHRLDAKTPSVGGIIARAAAAVSLGAGLINALGLLRKTRPGFVIGFGGYPAAPALIAARILNIPHGVHEQNAVLGRVNRLAAGSAAFVATAFESVAKLPAGARQAHVGNPVRPPILARADAPFAPPEEGGEVRLFVFGGSQGADLFARIVPEAIGRLPQELRGRLRVVHQAREERADDARAAYAAAGVQAEIAPFFKDIAERIASAHLVVGRAGASSVTEIALIGRPSILCPLGVAMDDAEPSAEVLRQPPDRLGDDAG
ncbi:MAG: glycosyltransferase, partial [Pseudomonadota bacterium]